MTDTAPQIKVLLYVSTATNQSPSAVPREIGSILYRGRAANAVHGITGALLYKRGSYLQILEGPAPAIDRLLSNLRRDSRHRGITTIFQQDNCKRCFSSGLHLIKSPADEDLVRFLKEHFPVRTSESEQPLSVIGKFLNLQRPSRAKDATSQSEKSPPSFENKVLRLEKWPRFHTSSPTKAEIELCALLRGSSIHYEMVKQRHSFATRQALDTSLQQFLDAGVLSVRDEPASSISARKRVSANRNRVSFSSKMRGFLKRVSASAAH